MSAYTVTIEQARDQLADLIQRAESGTEIVILSGNKPAARLLPFRGIQPREFGKYRDLIQISDDFDEPLPAEFWSGKTP